ncbi:hypothetical protein DPX16_5434 [Anabarilius grahami]|uniref:Uncharacterized protein n=1 Tax=Anabarilius grahami TaxID=495550 RepID=A0A3N0Z9N0_ANAGA|nr:hypothetical protein DPX16_5434 [Anabarilius grahami]
MRIVSNGVQPYIVQTGVDTDGETQEEVTTFRMKLDVSECQSEFSPSPTARRRFNMSNRPKKADEDQLQPTVRNTLRKLSRPMHKNCPMADRRLGVIRA